MRKYRSFPTARRAGQIDPFRWYGATAVNWGPIAAYSLDARSRAVAGASFACPQAALLALLERRSQHLASQPAKSCSPAD